MRYARVVYGRERRAQGQSKKARKKRPEDGLAQVREKKKSKPPKVGIKSPNLCVSRGELLLLSAKLILQTG